MSEERKIILRMLKEGKIDEEEALKLLDAVDQKSSDTISEEELNKSEKKLENSVNGFVTKILDGVESVFIKAGDAINDIDLDLSEISYEFSNKRGRVNNVIEITEIKESVNFNIQNKNGKVELKPWDRNHIEIYATIRFNEKELRGSENFVLYKKEGINHLVGINPDIDMSNYNVKFEIRAPRESINDLIVNNTNAKIEIKYLNLHNVELNTTNAKIELDGIFANNLVVNTSNAKIELNSIEANKIDTNSTNAKIELNDVSSDSIDVNTTNGKIILLRIDSESIIASNTNGAIQSSLLGSKARHIDLTSTNGGIYLENVDFNKSVKAVLNGRDNGTISPSLIKSNEGDNLYYTDNYDENASDKLDISLSTTLGKISVI